MKFTEGFGNTLFSALKWLGNRCTACVSNTERWTNAAIGAPDSSARDKIETEFLPAALEIVETPPSPIGRAVAGTIIILFCVVLTWACLSKIDIVATAPGKIIVSGRTKVIQPFETGVIKDILVRDGQNVKIGDTLIELDSTINNAERDHLRNDLLAAQLDVARLRAALADGNNPLAAFDPPKEADSTLVGLNRQLLLDQVAEQRSKLAAFDRQQAQREAERATTVATIEKLEAINPIIEQRVDIRKYLADKELGSKLNLLEVVQQLTESRQELAVQKKRLQEAEAAFATVSYARAQSEAEFRRSRSTELAEAERKAIGLRDDLIKAEQRTKLQVLTAPVDGVVQQLAVHTIGGVVTPAQSLLAIVPTDSHFEIEAMISNRDIGFVSEGQVAQIKIDTFNFTRYGLRHGRVLSVSHDAITREKSQEKGGDGIQGAPTASSEPPGQELVYSAIVSLDQTQMQVDDKVVKLTPGMAVTVELQTGSRTVMSYLLSPLFKYTHDSLRER